MNSTYLRTSSTYPWISTSCPVGILVAVSIAISNILVILICLWKNRRSRNNRYHDARAKDVVIEIPPAPPKHGDGFIPSAPSAGSKNLGSSISSFSYEELESATGGFARSNLLGEGGFGCVYMGVLPGGQLVAVKQLKVGGGQGEQEFRAEVEIISRVHHRHLVSLVGYCIAGTQRLLVYDYVPNNTLQYHLHDRRKGGPIMDWPARLKVAYGAARGLAYLHEDCHPRIIHRYIKASNILLDHSFHAKVSDFGLAKLTLDTNTHVSTRVMGTFGYLAPEYASSGKLTEKSDVFSFGVVLLELLTGGKPVDAGNPLGEESLVERARPVLMQVNSEEDLELLADPSLNGTYDRKEMFRMVQAAAACVHHSASKRPRMGQVVRVLGEDVLLDFSEGLKGGHNSVQEDAYCNADVKSSFESTSDSAIGGTGSDSGIGGCTSDSEIYPSTFSDEYHTKAKED